MNKWMLSFLLLLATGASLCANDAWIEARAAYFHPTGSRFNHIYNDNASYGGKITATVWEDLAAWFSIDGYHLKGKSIGLGNATDLDCVPLGLGAQYMFPRYCCTQLYLGAGVDWSFFSIRDHSRYVIHKIDRNTWGGRFLGGALVNVTDHFFLDVFVEYTYSRLNYDKGFVNGVYTSSADVSHVNVGLGLGYTFDYCQW